MKTTTPDGCCPGLLILLGGLGICGAFFNGNWSEFYNSFPPFAVFFIAGIAWFRSRKPSFHVAIASASGEVEALKSADKDYMLKIVASINEAIGNHQS